MVEKPREIAERTFQFAVTIVLLCKKLKEAGVFQETIRQLLKSGTAIGANVAEGQSPQSRADFISKYSIACKESKESLFWLQLIKTTEPQLENLKIGKSENLKIGKTENLKIGKSENLKIEKSENLKIEKFEDWKTEDVRLDDIIAENDEIVRVLVSIIANAKRNSK